MLKEFRNFIMRGNVMDLAVAVIMGAAFSAIVSSLVADVITPGLLNPVMEKLQVEKLEGLSWNGVLYGKFLAAVLNFLVVSLVIFLLIRTLNKVQAAFDKKADEEKPPAAVPENVKLLIEIRDLLKQQSEAPKTK